MVYQALEVVMSKTLSDLQTQLSHTHLKDEAASLLRDHIVLGRIAPGTKLTERDVAQMLGTSRVPARDALNMLESEGLVITTGGARHVISPSMADVRAMHQVRVQLELLAARLAAQNVAAGNIPEAECQQLEALNERLRKSMLVKDVRGFVSADLSSHQIVWEMSRNPYLLDNLKRISGPIYMMIYINTADIDWESTIATHDEFVRSVCSGDAKAAMTNIESHLGLSMSRTEKFYPSRGISSDKEEAGPSRP